MDTTNISNISTTESITPNTTITASNINTPSSNTIDNTIIDNGIDNGIYNGIDDVPKSLPTSNIMSIVCIICCLVILSSIIVGVVMYIRTKNTSTTVTDKNNMSITTTTTTTNIPISSQLITDFQPNINTHSAWKGMNNAGNKNLNNLNYTIQCNKPWSATYTIGCNLNGKTVYSNPIGPVNYGNWQGPSIRLAEDGQQQYCSMNGGTLSVLRQRPGESTPTDITQYLTNYDGTGIYNGSDPIFIDRYNLDCYS